MFLSTPSPSWIPLFGWPFFSPEASSPTYFGSPPSFFPLFDIWKKAAGYPLVNCVLIFSTGRFFFPLQFPGIFVFSSPPESSPLFPSISPLCASFSISGPFFEGGPPQPPSLFQVIIQLIRAHVMFFLRPFPSFNRRNSPFDDTFPRLPFLPSAQPTHAFLTP